MKNKKKLILISSLIVGIPLLAVGTNVILKQAKDKVGTGKSTAKGAKRARISTAKSSRRKVGCSSSRAGRKK